MAKWIQGIGLKKGALHEELGIKGKIPLSTLEDASKKGGKLGKRARLALTFRGFNKGRADVVAPGRTN